MEWLAKNVTLERAIKILYRYRETVVGSIAVISIGTEPNRYNVDVIEVPNVRL